MAVMWFPRVHAAGADQLQHEQERIAANVRSLIGELRRRMPESTIVLQSVVPRHRKFATRIVELNALYEEIALESGATYVDLLASAQRRPRRASGRIHLRQAAPQRPWLFGVGGHALTNHAQGVAVSVARSLRRFFDETPMQLRC
jgi:hypothetical protein